MGFPCGSADQESARNAGAAAAAKSLQSCPTLCDPVDPGSWVGKICWRNNGLSIPVFLGFPCGSVGKESACNVGDWGSIPGLGRSPFFIIVILTNYIFDPHKEHVLKVAVYSIHKCT